jgi:hypothetical protein
MDPRVQQNKRAFFSQQNEGMLYNMLVNNFQQKLGAQLNEAQTSRLERGLEFYMSEVFESGASLPVQTLNKEVLAATASDFNDYIQRKEAVTQGTPQMFQETSQRYEQIQQDRQRSLETPRPSIPDYVQPILIKEDDSTSALSLFEDAKKRRNLEVNKQAEDQLAKRSASALQPLYLEEARGPDLRSMYDKPLDLVVAAQRELPGRADVNSTLARSGPGVANRGSLQQDIIIKQEDIQSYKETEYNLSVYSADRSWESDLNNGENRFNFSVNLFSNNSPTGVNLMPKAANRFRNIVRIEFVKAILPIEVTDLIVRKLTSTTSPNLTQALMNAEAISITSVNAGVATAPLPAANSTQSNFQLLQLKNALLTTMALSYDTLYSKNIYGYPFITLNINELDTNTYGTSDSMDNAFGVLQYDSNWSDNTDSLGFASLIPKHMKCQRIYSPTPLATLNKLTIRLQQPNGELVNTTSDTFDISGIFLSRYSSIRSYFNNTVDLSGSAYADPTGEYIWLDCKKWFSRYQLAVGDRIQVKNLTCASPSVAISDVMTFLQNSSGLVVVGMAYTRQITAEELIAIGLNANQVTSGTPGTVASSVLVDGPNKVGYSRFVVLRGKFQDPTTGSVSVNPYGGSFDNSTVSTAMLSGETKIVPGKFINLSRQTQLIFRVITREYDSTSLVRPDNL